MTKLEENVDYKFEINSSEDSNSVEVRLLSGQFEGVLYRYGKVSFEEDEENDSGYLIFGYDVVDQKEHLDLEENLEFKTRIGDVLTAIMVKQMNL